MPQGWEIEGETPKPTKAKKAVATGWEVEGEAPKPTWETPEWMKPTSGAPSMFATKVPHVQTVPELTESQKAKLKEGMDLLLGSSGTPGAIPRGGEFDYRTRLLKKALDNKGVTRFTRKERDDLDAILKQAGEEEEAAKHWWTTNKLKGMGKAWVGGSNLLGEHLGQAAFNPNSLVSTYANLGGTFGPFGPGAYKAAQQAFETYGVPQLRKSAKEYGTPTAQERSVASDITGGLPIMTAGAVPFVGPALLGGAFYGGAHADVDSINAMRTTENISRAKAGLPPLPMIGPWERAGYAGLQTAGALGMSQLPMFKGKDPASVGTGFYGKLATSAAKSGTMMGLQEGAGSLYRQNVFGTEEAPGEAALHGIKMGAMFAGLHHGGEALLEPAQKRPGPLKFKDYAASLPELDASVEDAIRARPEGVSPREIATASGSSIRDVNNILNQKANDPEHPLEKVVDKKGRVRYKLTKPETPNAPQEIPQQEGVPVQPGGRAGIGQTPEAGAGDSVQRTAEGGGEAKAQEGQVAPVVPGAEETTLKPGVPDETLPAPIEAKPGETPARTEGGVRPVPESGAERGAAAEVQPGMGEVPPVAAGGGKAVGPEAAQGARKLIEWLSSEEGLTAQQQAPQVNLAAEPVSFKPREGEPIEFNRDISGRNIIIDEANPTSKTVGQISVEVDPNGDLYVKFAHNGGKPGAGTFLYQEAIKLAKEYFPEVTDQSKVYGDVTPDAVAFRGKVGGTSIHTEGDSSVAVTTAENFLKRGAKPTEEAPAQEAAKPSMTFKVKGGGNRVVELDHPDDIAAYQKAQEAHAARLKAIDEDPSLAGDENKKARGDAKRDTGKQLWSDKRAIEQQIQERQAAQRKEESGGQVQLESVQKKASANGEGGDSQSASVTLADQQRDARNFGKMLMDHGIFNKAEWTRAMKEEFGTDAFTDHWLHREVFPNLLQQKSVDPTVIRSKIVNPRSAENGVTQAIDTISQQYKGGDEVPKVPENHLLEGPAPDPGTLMSKTETDNWASNLLNPRSFFMGLTKPWKKAPFQSGYEPTTDMFLSELAASSGTKNDQAWASKVFHGLESSKEDVSKINGPLITRKLDLLRRIVPFEAEAKEAEASPSAKADFDNSSRGQEYKAIKDGLGEVEAGLAKNEDVLAKKYADVRILLHAGEEPGSPRQKELEALMSPDELRMAKKAADYFKERGEDLKARGISTREGAYVPFSMTGEASPEAWQALKDALKSHLKKEPTAQEVMDFAHRQGDRPMVPSLAGALAEYIPQVNRKLHYQPLLDRWMPAINSGFNGTNPHLANYIGEMFNKNMVPGTRNEILDLWRNWTHAKLLAGSMSVPTKHVFKVPLTYADHGAMDFMRGLVGAGDAVLPEGWMDNPLVKKAKGQISKLVGGASPEDLANAQHIARSLAATKEINEAISDIPWLTEPRLNRNALTITNDALHKANSIGSTPVRVVEQTELGINVLASLLRARDAGLGGEESIRGAIHSVLANNFRGAWDTSPFLKTEAGKIGGMFSGTPSKIIARYAEYALRPDSVDIYGTKNGVKLMRSILALGALYSLGKNTDTDLLGKAIHTPFLNKDERTGQYALNLGPLSFGGKVGEFGEGGITKELINQMPAFANKGLRLATGDIPRIYAGSKARYTFGLPSKSTQEALQEASAHKEAAKTRKAIHKTPLMKAIDKFSTPAVEPKKPEKDGKWEIEK